MRTFGKPILLKVRRRKLLQPRNTPVAVAAFGPPTLENPDAAVGAPSSAAPVLRTLHRPARVVRGEKTFTPIPRYRTGVYKASLFQCALRLVHLFLTACSLGFLVLIDWVTRRSGPHQFGRRLRHALESMGGLFVKLGQQLATRVDLLDQGVCYELADLLDSGPKIPIADSIAIIERATGKRLAETFAAFDPDPVGSASVSCVYHARLITGEEVAIKVRRPGIGELFAADLRIINLFIDFIELLTVIRPGFGSAVRDDLSTMMLEELNFRMEARYQDLWRRQAKRDKQNFVTSPKVYFDLSGDDVIVSEFVTGIWITDLLAIKEQGDIAGLRYLDSLNIDLKKVAARLVRARHWGVQENTFFHADPHPANVVVQPGGQLVFVDFGACAPTAHTTRRNYVELFRREIRRDGDGMVRVFVEMISPLPYLDLTAFSNFAETQTWNWLYALESPHSEWWERTSAAMWIRMFEAARKYQIPISARLVRLMRSTLLYETIAARLNNKIDMEKQFIRYQRDAERRALKRVFNRIAKFRPGQFALAVERGIDYTRRLIYRVEKIADTADPTFIAAINKASYMVTELLHLAITIAWVTTLGVGLAYIVSYFERQPSVAVLEQLKVVTSNPFYWIVLVPLVFRSLRLIQFRLFDPDNVEEQL